MKKIVYIIFVALLAAVTGPVWGQSQHTLGNIPEGWKVKANGDSVPVVNGTATITDGATVVLTPPYPAFVKNVTLTDATCRRITLDTVHHHFVAQNCDTLTGTLTENVKISIAAGATVTLDGVSINANGSWKTGNFAGITCLGNATIILKDGTTNTVKGFNDNNPGIFVPVNSTLTIKGETLGTGKLIASSNGNGAGIGGGWDISCGNIRIEGGIIEATGGESAAGIGSGYEANCGDITISGGTINATGGPDAAGIGSGYGADCGAITITSDVTRVTATKGADVPNSIGKGSGGTCGMITFGTQQMYNGTTWTTTPTSGEIYGGLKLIISNNNDTWDLTPASAPVISCRRVDLSQITADSVIQNCDTLTGTLGANVKISIAAGATVTLDGVSINADGNWTSGDYAGITCLGDATIILKDDTMNTVKGCYNDYPGIFVPVNSTLTIQGGASGTGKLIASSNGYGAGIGGGYGKSCGNINIQGGDIKATGGMFAAGIGNGDGSSCGDITISGGTVNAKGGIYAAGIGSGNYNASCDTITISGGNVTATGGKYAAGIGSGEGSSCGDIMITSGVTRVTATKGEDAPNSIGAGQNGTCGTVTIGDATGAITTSPYTYPAP